MTKTLQHLAETCHGDDRPECPIIEELAEEAEAAEAAVRALNGERHPPRFGDPTVGNPNRRVAMARLNS